MILPHPSDWNGRSAYVVPFRVGELSMDARTGIQQASLPPYNRHFQLLFQLDEVRHTGEILWHVHSQAFATGLRWVRDNADHLVVAPL